MDGQPLNLQLVFKVIVLVRSFHFVGFFFSSIYLKIITVDFFKKNLYPNGEHFRALANSILVYDLEIFFNIRVFFKEFFGI